MFTKIKSFVETIKIHNLNKKNTPMFNLGFDPFAKKYKEGEYPHPVYISNKVMMAVVGYFMTEVVPMAIAQLHDDGSHSIIMNEELAKLDEDTIHAIIMHEVGHIKLGHLKGIEGFCLDDEAKEIEADKYAMSHGAKTMYAFEVMRKIWEDKGYGNLYEVSTVDRIAALTGKTKPASKINWTKVGAVAGVVTVAVGVGVAIVMNRD